ncbi:hypothetical protein [Mycobacteroides abscessus]|uniref:hypothetical protein n=1 Tax=Mycobacteroides abscessus TaxID=36809 RepID=UPI00092A24C6|nr:hypothetical protein [Mycobacteroides abscessus]SHZ29976.1 Uncharacterised protein [Mycobacteroides abscessus subsp. abscessus]SHZ89475.1 Uncharacterised protein [Mycobacteroides abscessus subsp. abscessus]SHZ89991.1 Uncharacterised protein [Mycobacteroides abscessus subsp. abscessus]SIA65121.1 Uncharacterised protein [Mycobacteroides abscessus subsp. abscessus]SIC38767.1 Uncharacterised protein [Mycobacteroides abscessus subsp. abscessus]
MTAPAKADGILQVIVWPVYIGLAGEDGREPLHPEYRRGQINWQPTPNSTIEGSAVVHAPAGRYPFFTYWMEPIGGAPVGMSQPEHPLVFDIRTVVDVRPIKNGDLFVTNEIRRAGL